MPRRSIPAIFVLLLVLAASGCGNDSPADRPTLSEVMPDVSGADPRLVAISEQANQLLPGGAPAFDARLKELRGLPVVVNKWAHWCGPCVAEFPEFQQTAKKLGAQVAFLGVNVFDSEAKATEFLRKYPVPYPSYSDPDMKISKQLPPPKYAPITNIYDVAGKLVHVEAGPYESAAELQSDIDRYAGPLKSGPSS
ncbi:MAG: TlpA family protein disulfide reductase [Thermoleophilaceae bacterium]|nr:TlpA family protein disulfide reductase [Thermoleophilaceae bacterium]